MGLVWPNCGALTIKTAIRTVGNREGRKDHEHINDSTEEEGMNHLEEERAGKRPGTRAVREEHGWNRENRDGIPLFSKREKRDGEDVLVYKLLICIR